ncbi:carboxymuconolactone decarboxylase family protein [Roseomonas populi]|uniref:Carboxymuconolactone decarboxylase family protein n=1 Tax=Roseomonas populi TaxID=3121582 RepID=A0ABT1WYY8_9PROT|nr:carboxymuconolactone decarboxylase family protein [Roseomonas pecuniae]MCR0981068.1 carboxymuconolactone decarboxylase family protein [Roseomonas pecuniae]
MSGLDAEIEALRADPAFAQAFEGLADASADGVLPRRLQALLLVAVNGAVTHLNEAALRAAIRDARTHGAAAAELREVLQLTSVLGIHALSIGVPALLDELAAAGQAFDRAAPLTEEQARIKADFTAGRGRWSDRWEALLRLDTRYFEAYTRFSSHPWTSGTLAPKEREFVYIAIDCATTHLFEPGLRVHIRSALSYGASAAEIVAVLKLTTLMGIQTATLGERLLAEEYGTKQPSS